MRKKKITERHKRVAVRIVKGESFSSAMQAEGYSKASARTGFRGTPKRYPALHEAILAEALNAGRNIVQNRTMPSRDEMEQTLVGELMVNLKNGEGERRGSNAAAKLLGSMRRYDVFNPELAIDLSTHIEATLPPELADSYKVEEAEEPKLIEAESVKTED